MNKPSSLEAWREQLDNYQPDPSQADDAYALACCRLAFKAADEGNVGVGAILVNPDGTVEIEAHNTIFSEGFRSDLHAEMVVMNEFESNHRERVDLRKYTLVTSLEPCVMCLARLVLAGVGRVLYVAEDNDGGMTRTLTNLPPIFQEFIDKQGQTFTQADCSDFLKEASEGILTPTRIRIEEFLGR